MDQKNEITHLRRGNELPKKCLQPSLSLLNEVFQGCPTRTRSQGRPRTPWKDLCEDLEEGAEKRENVALVTRSSTNRREWLNTQLDKITAEATTARM